MRTRTLRTNMRNSSKRMSSTDATGSKESDLALLCPVCPNPISSWMKSTRRNLLQLEEIASQFPGSSTVEHSAVNRRVASSNLARGAKILLYQAITEFGQSIRLATECLGLRSEIAIAQVAGPKSLFESPTEDQQALS